VGRPSRHRGLKLGLAIAAFLVLGLGAVLADAYLQAYRAYGDMRGVIPSLTQARQYLARGELPPAGRLDRASGLVSTAQRSLDNARVTLRITGAIPFFNRPVVAVRKGVAAAREEATAAAQLRDIVQRALGDAAVPGSARFGRASGTPIFTDGVANVKLIDELTPLLESALAHLEQADADVRAIPQVPFAHRLDQLKAQAGTESSQAIALTKDVLSGARLLPSLLGANGTRTYFLAMQNSADQRATGGDVLAYAFVTISKGRLSLQEGGPIRFIDNRHGGFPSVKLPAALQWFVDSNIHPRQIPRIANINLSPDFPMVAGAWADLVEKATGRKVDGVIAMDPVAISYLMGPKRVIDVPTYPRPITASSVIDVVENDQYRLANWQQQLFPAQLIQQAWELFRNPSPLVHAVRGMGQALRERHLQLWSIHPDEQAEIARLGWDGALRTGPGDFLAFTDNKLLANKVDFYSHISLDYHVTVLASGDISSTCDITFKNETPPGEPYAITFGTRNGAYALNQALLGLYVPQVAELTSSNPPGVLPDHLEGGAKVFLRTVGIAGGKTAKLRFAYSVPGAIISSARGKVYRLRVPHQPMVNPVELTVTVTLPAGSTVRAAPGWTVNGNVLSFQASLTEDLVREIQF